MGTCKGRDNSRYCNRCERLISLVNISLLLCSPLCVLRFCVLCFCVLFFCVFLFDGIFLRTLLRFLFVLFFLLNFLPPPCGAVSAAAAAGAALSPCRFVPGSLLPGRGCAGGCGGGGGGRGESSLGDPLLLHQL